MAAATAATVSTNTQVLLASRPVSLPDASTFRIVSTPIPEVSSLTDGQLLIKTLYISLDPAMRGWMNDQKSYVPPVPINGVMRAIGMGRVIESKNAKFKAGDTVTCMPGMQEYVVSDGQGVTAVPSALPVDEKVWLGPLGMTGMTAYFGLLEIGRPKAGETVLVSGAAGATGSIVGQIAKDKGCRVVGLAGTQKKCEWLVKECGFDEAINYRDTAAFGAEGLAGAVRKACPNGIDVFFDNVGGETLDIALQQIRKFGRIVLCGAISQYNTPSAVGIRHTTQLVIQSASMTGFIVFNYVERFREGIEYLSRLLLGGKLKYAEHVVDGLENAPAALLKLFDGSNDGKLLVRVAKDTTAPAPAATTTTA